ncbi:hypothetical protein HRbin39_01339 [bacterium HR39]|nr:hypothetical protein HRbin39_01339 [bacterium HR39]
MPAGVVTLIRRFGRDPRGAVAPLVALALIPLALAAGLAIDAGRALLVRAELARAADSAALAAGARGGDDPSSLVLRFIEADFAAGGDVRLDEVRALARPDGRIGVLVRARVATTLMRLVGVDEVPVSARTVVARATRPLEVALVLDVTGSMGCCGKIEALRRAASDLVDILFEGRGVSDIVRIGIVPFNARVNIGIDHRDWLLPRDRSGPWNGCPEARSNATALTDAPPAVELFPARPARGRSGRGSWGSQPPQPPCPPLAVLPLSFTRAELLSFIALLPATGTTRIDMGARWGWRLLSEKWMGLWHEPVRHGRREEVLKAVVIMTDGENVVNGAYDEVSSVAEADANLLTLCTRMKDDGILVYTVTFMATARSDALMARCATSPAHHFRSPTNADLVRAFRSIAGELSALRIVE